jgi:hypothetical protein
MKTLQVISTFLVFFAVTGSAMASGFRCQSTEGYSVKEYDHTDPHTGTRVPAVLVISYESQGTLLVAKNEEIRKHNRVNSIQYSVDGNEKLNADTAIFQVMYKPGQEVSKKGVPGQLILVQSGTRDAIDLQCERYLKH